MARVFKIRRSGGRFHQNGRGFYRIKRSASRIIDPRRKLYMKIAAIAAGVLLLFAAGWFAYEPLVQALLHSGEQEQEPSSEPVSEVSSEPEPEPEEEADLFANPVLASSVPAEVFADDARYAAFLAGLSDDVNAVVLDLKDSAGTVTYRSPQASVAEYGTQAEDAVDLASRIEAARLAGYGVIARIWCFEDHTAPSGCYEGAVKYGSADGVLWLDNSAENGGRSWLNPCSDTARKYVLDIVCDAVNFGADAVVLEGLRFPPDSGIQYAWFSNESFDRLEALSSFTQLTVAEGEKQSVPVLAAYDASRIVLGTTSVYGGSPATLPASGYAPVLDFASLAGAAGLSGALTYQTLPADFPAATSALIDALGYGKDNLLLPFVEVENLSAENLAAVLAALKEKGMPNAVLIGGGMAAETSETAVETVSEEELSHQAESSSGPSSEAVSSSGSVSSKAGTSSRVSTSSKGDSSSEATSSWRRTSSSSEASSRVIIVKP